MLKRSKPGLVSSNSSARLLEDVVADKDHNEQLIQSSRVSLLIVSVAPLLVGFIKTHLCVSVLLLSSGPSWPGAVQCVGRLGDVQLSPPRGGV